LAAAVVAVEALWRKVWRGSGRGSSSLAAALRQQQQLGGGSSGGSAAVGAAAASSKKQEEAKEQGRAFCIVITFPPKSPLIFTKFVLFRTSHTTQMCV
jgi:hypothetical protein